MTTVPGIRYSYPEEGTIMVHVEGAWAMGRELPGANEVCEHAAARPGTRRIVFDHAGLSDWDSSLLTFLIGLQQGCASTGLSIEFDGLPAGAVRLLRLASALTDLEMRPGPRVRAPFLNRLGLWSLSLYGSLTAVLAFSGEVMAAAVRMARGRARFRRTDLASLLYECGPQALPIVSLISVLVGIILAFVGVVQLRMFGAQIYIANLVGIAMVREMGALMTAIIMSGRTGASYATQLGTMEVNEEIDALKTLGIMPAEFLVLPRIIALVLMMPLLCVYADIVGILGGAVVGVAMFDLSPLKYWEQTLNALNLTQFTLGVVKSTVFALLIACAGCYHGMRAERSASAVGYAATRAVVVGIVLIVVTDGLFAMVTSILRI
ncbi:MAG TPA: ABC transporter permease [Deltaproteobacteria bacterium]|nr:ABC transporter permease [Deltaproteobacteria bacterium]